MGSDSLEMNAGFLSAQFLLIIHHPHQNKEKLKISINLLS